MSYNVNKGRVVMLFQLDRVSGVFSNSSAYLFCDAQKNENIVAADCQLLFLYKLESQIRCMD